MNRVDLLHFLRSHRYAVQASASPAGTPQAAVVGFAVSDDFEMVFDTLAGSRKMQNLRRNPSIALVVGGLGEGDERTVQYEGLADLSSGPALEHLKRLYLARFPEGITRQSLADLVYVRVRPRWLRYSDFNRAPPEIHETTFGA